MNGQLREIASRRAELADRGRRERKAIAGNRLWSWGPLRVTGSLLTLGRAVASSSYKYYAGDVLIRLWPVATLRWLRRGLKFYLGATRLKKALLR